MPLNKEQVTGAPPVQIIGKTETWLYTTGRDFEGQYRLPGYSEFQQDRAGYAEG